MNFIYCRRVFMAYKKEKSKRKLPKLLCYYRCKTQKPCKLSGYTKSILIRTPQCLGGGFHPSDLQGFAYIYDITRNMCVYRYTL